MPRIGQTIKLGTVDGATLGHQRLHALMLQRCWGARDLAEYLGQTRAAMYYWLFEDRPPSLKVGKKLRELGVEYKWFFEPPETKKERGQA